MLKLITIEIINKKDKLVIKLIDLMSLRVDKNFRVARITRFRSQTFLKANRKSIKSMRQEIS